MRHGIVTLLMAGAVGCAAPPPPESAPDAEGVTAAPAAVDPIPVWIDTDPSNRPGGYEVDDGFALIQSFNSPELAIRGVSLVFGNAPLDIEIPIGREIVQSFGPEGLGLHVGAASEDELGEPTEASEAPAEALRREPLRILVLGPGTNIGTVIQYPELADRMVELIAVAGRRPGQRFVNNGAVGRPSCDCNFDKDVESFRVILDAGVPLTLAPWEISSKVWMRDAEFDRLEAGTPATKWLVPDSRDWVERWRTLFGAGGYNPFDTLAVGYLTSPELMDCERLPAEIRVAPDDRVLAAGPQDGTGRVIDVPDKSYLVAATELDTTHSVNYCHTPAPGFADDLMERLLRD